MAERNPNDRRRSQRFPLHLPVRVVKLRNRRIDLWSETRDVSSVGAYFWSDDPDLVAGATIEFRVTLRDGTVEGPLRIYCKGRVTRVERPAGPLPGGIATTIDRYRFERPDAASH